MNTRCLGNAGGSGPTTSTSIRSTGAAAWEMTADEAVRCDELRRPPRVGPDWTLERVSQDR
jgi:hypothetical protein